MKRFQLVTLIAVFSMATTFMFAQRVCPSHDILHEQMQHNPMMEQNREEIERFTAEFAKNYNSDGRATYNIPVVVHVLYTNATNNISDAQIQSQIDVLNKDFQLLNADNTLVPAAFAALKANADISFCLAKQDASGAATTGITRKLTTITSFSTNDAIKKVASGGVAPWDATKYLNIWVAPALNNGVLGYAQFPGGSALTDGVVVAHTCMGSIGTASAPFNKGRTATHEVGHWLNLNHIWGDDGTACTGTDNVTDTPNAAGPNYGCPSFPKVSCSNGVNGDMFMNYMDYTDDACMFMFSTGQKTRMHAVLAANGFRSSLAASPGCNAPSGGTICSAPSGLTNSAITTSGATLSWSAATSATSYSLQYKLSSATTFTTVAVTGTSFALTGLAAGSTYNWQVQSVCSATSSSAFTSSTVTTTAVVVTCSDIYETNNTSATAKAITVGATITAAIGTSTDVDFFSFSNTTALKNIKITLTATKDYDLQLYNSAGKLVKSASTASNPEVLKYNNTVAAGTYHVRVVGYNGAFSASDCYTLKVETQAANWKADANSSIIDNGDEVSTDMTEANVHVMPNPVSDDLRIELDDEAYQTGTVISMIDQVGRIIIQKEMEGTETRLDVSNFPTGMYIIQVRRDEQIVNKRVMVRH